MRWGKWQCQEALAVARHCTCITHCASQMAPYSIFNKPGPKMQFWFNRCYGLSFGLLLYNMLLDCVMGTCSWVQVWHIIEHYGRVDRDLILPFCIILRVREDTLCKAVGRSWTCSLLNFIKQDKFMSRGRGICFKGPGVRPLLALPLAKRLLTLLLILTDSVPASRVCFKFYCHVHKFSEMPFFQAVMPWP